VHLAQAKDARSLRHALDQEHTRHHRITREVALELRLVDRDVLDADAMVFTADVDDAVDHHERVAMRKEPQDFQNFRGFRRRAAHSASPSAGVLLRPARTRRRTVAWPRFHSIAGSAGKPAQRLPAGTCDMTPALAPSTAPVPIVKWSATPTCPASTT